MARRFPARSRHVAALAAVVALALTGCSNNDAKRSDVVDAMSDAGLDDDQANCVGDAFEEEFDQGTLNDLASADEPADFPDGTEDRVNEILARCTGQASPGGDDGSDEGGEPSEDEGGESDGSSTTATTDEDTSDTTAG